MDLRPFIEHTMLKPEATESEIACTVDHAIEHRVGPGIKECLF
jgi:hypothetical protein